MLVDQSPTKRSKALFSTPFVSTRISGIKSPNPFTRTFELFEPDDTNFNYLDTLLKIAPISVPRHVLFGELKLRSPEDIGKCLLQRYFVVASDVTLDFRSGEMFRKYFLTMKDFSSSLRSLIYNAKSAGVEDEIGRILVEHEKSLYEMDTWGLLLDLFTESPILHQEAGEKSDRNFCNKKIKSLLGGGGSVNYYNRLANWLEKCCAVREEHEIKKEVLRISKITGYLPVTHRYLVETCGLNGESISHPYVKTLDFDASTRLRLPLLQEDIDNKLQHLHLIFKFIRYGKTFELPWLCDFLGHPWRFCSIMDIRNINSITLNEDDCEDEPSNFERYESFINVAKEISNDNSVSSIERAIYGVFCGNVDAMLLACDSYEDCLWAHLVKIVVTCISQMLEREFHLNTVRQEDINFFDVRDEFELKKIIDKAMEFSRNKCSKVADFFHQIQNMVIFMRNDIDEELIIMTNQWTRDFNILRFLAHFALAYKELDLIRDSTLVFIIKKYIETLILIEKHHLIARYVSLLPEMFHVEVYAEAMASIQTIKNKEDYIKWADESGLNYVGICKAISLLATDEYLLHCENSELLTNDELTKSALDSLEWVFMVDDCHLLALFLSLKIVNLCTVRQNFQLALLFFEKIPFRMISELTLKMISMSSDKRVLSDLALMKYKYLNKILEIQKSIAVCNGLLGANSPENSFVVPSAIDYNIFPPLADQAESNFWNGKLNHISENICELCCSAISMSIEWFECVKMHDFDNFPLKMPHSDHSYLHDCKVTLKLFVPLLVWVLLNLNHLNNNHIKCLEVTHMIAEFPDQLVEFFMPAELSMILKRISDCFARVGFSNTNIC